MADPETLQRLIDMGVIKDPALVNAIGDMQGPQTPDVPSPGMERGAFDGSPVQSGVGLGNVPPEQLPPRTVAQEDMVSAAGAAPVGAAPVQAQQPARPIRVARAGNAFRPLQGSADEALMDAGGQRAEAFDRLRQNADASGEAHQQASEQSQQALDERDRARAETADAMRAHEQAYAARNEKLTSQLHQLDEDAKNIKDSRSTGQKVAGAIATGLGALAQANYAVAGIRTDNEPAKMIQRSVEQDIERQREALATKRARISSELSLSRQMFGDTMEATKYAEALRAEKYLDHLRTIEATAQRDQSKIAARNAIDTLEADVAVKKEDAALSHKQRVDVAATQADQGIRTRAAAATNAARRARAKGQAAASAPELPPGFTFRGGSGLKRFGETKDANREKAIAKVQAGAELVETLDKIDKIAEDNSIAIRLGYTDAAAAAESLESQALILYKEAKGLGALDAGALKIGRDVIGNSGSLLNQGRARTKRAALKGSISQSMRKEASRIGLQYQPPQEKYKSF